MLPVGYMQVCRIQFEGGIVSIDEELSKQVSRFLCDNAGFFMVDNGGGRCLEAITKLCERVHRIADVSNILN